MAKRPVPKPPSRTHHLTRSTERKLPDKYAKVLAGYVEPLPRNALRTLLRAALRRDHAGRAARYFLFWLDGEVPPDGPSDDGGSELLNLTEKQKEAALEVLKWWTTLERRHEPLLNLHEKIRARFADKDTVVRTPK